MEQNMEEAINRGCQLINRLELIQYRYFNGRPNWIHLKLEDLKLFIAYTYHGPPLTEENIDINKKNDDIFSHYELNIQKLVLNMIQKIKKLFPNDIDYIYVGHTITHSICKNKCNVCQNFPDKDIHQWYILRVKLDTSVIYIDYENNRIYKNWNEYIQNNTLPKGYMFYPESGYYEEIKCLTQNITPKSKLKETILNSVDLLGKYVSFTSGILFSSCMIFPIMTPMLMPLSAVLSISSSYTVSREIVQLSNLKQYNTSLFSKEAYEHWSALSIGVLGIISAPMTAAVRALELSQTTVTTTSFIKSLSIVQKSVCVAQCSMEVVNCTVNILVHKKKFTKRDILSFRLDVFMVSGKLWDVQYIIHIFECVVNGILWSDFERKILQTIPVCIGEFIFKAYCFIKKQFVEFSKMITKFLKENLTSAKFLICVRDFVKYIVEYKKQTKMMSDNDKLKHVVNDIITLPLWCDHSEEVKRILCSQEIMSFLRDKFGGGSMDLNLIKFCIEYVIEKAGTFHVMRNELIADLEHRGLNVNQLDIELCKIYNLAECRDSEYIKSVIKDIVKNVNEFDKAYNEYCTQPENMATELLVASYKNNYQTIHTYNIVPPCDNLDKKTCIDLAQSFTQSSKDSNYEFSNPQPNVCVLYTVKALLFNMVIFTTGISDGIQSLNITFYRDTQEHSYNK